jgi:competence protein ComEA
LAAVTVVGTVIAVARCRPSRPLEITLPDEPAIEGYVHVDGAVSNPGLYPLAGGDTVEDLLSAAGGTTAAADPDQLRLIVPEAGQSEAPQRININRAEAWLLEALPGIGPSLAAAIIEYRLANGSFASTADLTAVAGIGPATLEKLEPFITVAD